MKITKRQLRRIIKETLLREGAKEDVMAYYGEIADMHSDSDAMGDLLDNLTDADLVAAGWEGGKDEAENYEDDFSAIVNALTPETLNRLVKSMDPEDLARARGDDGEDGPKAGKPPTFLQLVKIFEKNPAEAFRLADAGGIRNDVRWTSDHYSNRFPHIQAETNVDLMNVLSGYVTDMINMAQDVLDDKYTKEQLADPERSGTPPQIYGGVADEFDQIKKEYQQVIDILDNEAAEFRYRLAEGNKLSGAVGWLSKSLDGVIWIKMFDENVPDWHRERYPLAPAVAELEKAMDYAREMIGE